MRCVGRNGEHHLLGDDLAPMMCWQRSPNSEDGVDESQRRRSEAALRSLMRSLELPCILSSHKEIIHLFEALLH